ncbi:maleate cis-trans isomerase family protein [Streptomyces antimycoticus]|uniref:maleate cis-trans isomerase family protein n=1 Tax=Streptomyces antimycoticus TaxID=68175 RepID=UPI000A380D17|nr:aspartate/glutamate racemase family protein [Streptomyces antimycoticus]
MTTNPGWRARIGLILPADNVLMEPELYSLRLPGVGFNALRIGVTTHDEMREDAVRLAGVSTEMGVDALVYACAETSFNLGSEGRGTLVEQISRLGGVPTVSATDALLAGVHALGVSRVSVLTPYRQKSGEALEETLRQNGVTPLTANHVDFSHESADPREWYVTNRVDPTRVYRLAKQVACADAEAVVIASTNLSTFPIIRRLELDLGKPVLTTNQCILRWCLTTLSLRAETAELGRLVESTNEVRGDTRG